MPPLQVRDLPGEVYEPLKRITEIEHRSLAQQTIVALEYFLEHHDIVDGKVVEKGRGTQAHFLPFERDGITYMTDPRETPGQRKARLDALFERIASRPAVPAHEGHESVADMIREMRDERNDAILHTAEEGPWQ